MTQRQAAYAIKDTAPNKGNPKVLAKGFGAVAEKILRLAFDNDVKVRTDPDLVEILSAIEVDCEIPIEALAAVSEILSYVYREAENQTDNDQAESFNE